MKNSQQLEIALDHYLLQILAQLPAESDLAARQAFSPKFLTEMEQVIRIGRKRSNSANLAVGDNPLAAGRLHRSVPKKRLLVAAVVLALLLSISGAVFARDAIYSFFIKVYEDFSAIIFDSGTTAAPSDLPAGKLPSALPEDYVLVERLEVSPELTQSFYVNPAGDELILEQWENISMQTLIDTKNVVTENILIDQAPGVYFSNKKYNCLIWQDGPNVMSISGILDKDQLINIVKFTK